MRRRSSTHLPRRAAVAVAAAGIVAAGVMWTSPFAPAGGSLPLQGDQFVSGNGGSADQVVSGTGSHWNVLNWAPGVAAAVPASSSINAVDDTGRTVKRVFLSTQSNPDVGSAASNINMSFSDDSGKSFLTTQRNYPTSALSMSRLADGSLMSIDFIPEWGDAAHTFTNLKVWTSESGAAGADGVKWTLHDAPVSMPADRKLGPMSQGLRVHRRLIELPDGTLMVPIYTVFQGSTRNSSAILQSTDQGASWSLRSVIPATNTPGNNETALSYTSDGRLTAVMRTTDSPETHLVQSFSDDDGKTWSEATDLLGPDGVVVHGIYPDLVLQPNGTLLLTTGRPDVRVYVSNDGTGKTWNSGTTVFANYPSAGSNGRYDGSSGNNTMENVGASRSILFYDQCHVWGCAAYDEQFGVSAQYVSAVTPGVGRIDVASKLIDGTATVSGDFAPADKTFPEQRPQGAFDGSSAPGAEAVLTATKGKTPQLVLALDHEYTLNKIGLMLGHGQAQSATVSLSTDGTHWSPPVVTATQRSDRSMRYADIAARSAKFIKVSGPVDVSTTVSELELYAADVDTFENEVAFSVPRGWTDAEHSSVTDVVGDPAYAEFGGYHSSTALRLWDKWTDANAHITRPTAHTGHLYAAMQWGSSDLRARFTFGVNGTAADGSSVKAWDFRLTQGSPAKLEAYNGTAWVTVGSFAGQLPTKAYLPLTINATTDKATVTLGTDTFTSTVRAAATTDLADLQFSSGDPAEYGGIYFLDDVSVGVDPGDPPALGALTFDRDQLTPGRPVTVSTTVTNPGDKPATDVSAELAVPAGWKVVPLRVPGNLAPGQKATASWMVTAPAKTAIGTYRLSASASYRSGDARMSTTLPDILVSLGVVPQQQMTATASTAQPGATYQPSNAIDGNPATIWHSKYSPTKDVPPQSITLDLGGRYRVTGLTYLPRQDSTTNGEITGYNVYTSTDGSNFTKVGSGIWGTDKANKTATVPATVASFVRLEATAAVGDFISAAELTVLGSAS